ncbi:MAG: CPBP family intramembrane metalloprotease [Clostridia bacterium]|nr:CPBP family intramembrane metalloprotease [Clostridia bacterium]
MAKKDVSKGISALLLTILVLLLGLSLCRQWLPAFGPGLTALIYGVVYLLPIIFYMKRRHYKAKNTLRLKSPGLQYLPLAIFFGLSLCLICVLINVGSNALFRSVFHAEFQPSIVDLSSESLGTLLVTSVLLPAVVEELLFRGLVQTEYEKYGTTIGVMLTALIFAVFHTSPAQISALFVAGVCYGVMTLIFRSVWPAVIAHAVNNLVAVLINRNQSYIKYLFQDSLFLVIALVACLLVLIITLKLTESAISKKLGKSRKVKGTKSLAYGDPLMSPYLWVFLLLCIGKMIYNGFF